jgi:hypothetical protein
LHAIKVQHHGSGRGQKGVPDPAKPGELYENLLDFSPDASFKKKGISCGVYCLPWEMGEKPSPSGEDFGLVSAPRHRHRVDSWQEKKGRGFLGDTG